MRTPVRIATLLFLWMAVPLTPVAASAQGAKVDTSKPLSLPAVLESVERHFPEIHAERARLDAQRGAVLSADGGFDPTLNASADITGLGYYDYRRVNASLEQPTPLWGSTLSVGWRWSDGNVPPYYGELETLSAGELRGALRVPLWRDGAIDERRARIRSADLGLVRADASLAATRLRAAREAVLAYLAWAAAGQRLRIAQHMLTLATTRDEFVRSRVAAGAVPSIEILENERAVVLRRGALVRAERAVEQAAIRLALYVRSERGDPVVLGTDALPDELPKLVDDEDHNVDSAFKRALEARPETRGIKARLAAARVEVDLAANRVGPRLDLQVGASKDLGSSASETERRVLGQTNLEGSLQFSLPIPLRADRGRLDKAASDARAVEWEAEWLSNQIMAEVRDAMSRLEAAERSLDLAARSAIVSREVADGERTRFELGSTSLLTVNLREEAAADAEVSLVDAQADVVASLAALRTARGAWPLTGPGSGDGQSRQRSSR